MRFCVSWIEIRDGESPALVKTTLRYRRELTGLRSGRLPPAVDPASIVDLEGISARSRRRRQSMV